MIQLNEKIIYKIDKFNTLKDKLETYSEIINYQKIKKSK